MYILFGIVALLGMIIGFNVLGIGIDFLENLLPKWLYIPLLSIGLFFLIRWIIRGIFENERELLYDLSDDINEIKRKLNIPTENRTQRQRDESTRRYIEKEVYKGRALRDFRKNWGFWDFHRYKGWIEFYIEEYNKEHPKKTICPKCKKLDNENTDGDCVDCEIKVVSLKEYNKNKGI